MNREIKFRAWVADEYQADGNAPKTYRMVNWSSDFFSDSSPVTGYSDCFPEYDPADKFPSVVLMQYTGITNNWKQDIYEGDIVEHGRAHGNGIATIRYSNKSFEVVSLEYLQPQNLGRLYSSSLNDSTDALNWMKSFRVIGNIYENPELFRFDWVSSFPKEVGWHKVIWNPPSNDSEIIRIVKFGTDYCNDVGIFQYITWDPKVKYPDPICSDIRNKQEWRMDRSLHCKIENLMSELLNRRKEGLNESILESENNVWDSTFPKQHGWYNIKWGPDESPSIFYVANVLNDSISGEAFCFGWAKGDDPEIMTKRQWEEDGCLCQPASDHDAQEAQRDFDLCYGE
ncbi:MAG: hypothetical protein GY928_33930 [Colwellia sp.]|nr:hypothetical protein [Colwellia sp.]